MTGIEVRVGKGTVIDAQGRLIPVPDEQCADLDAWLAAHANNLAKPPSP